MESKTNAPSFTVSLRGYDRMEVDEYLDSLAEALGQVEVSEDRNRAMQSEVDRLNSRIADLEQRISNDVPRTGAVLGERIAILLRSAEETAADTIGRAEATAAGMMEKTREDVASAEDQARGAIARGEDQARRIEAAAHAEAAEIVAEAEGRASARTHQIEQWAEQVISRTRAEEARMLAELADKREHAEADLEGLACHRDAVAATIAGLRESLGEALGLVAAGRAEAASIQAPDSDTEPLASVPAAATIEEESGDAGTSLPAAFAVAAEPGDRFEGTAEADEADSDPQASAVDDDAEVSFAAEATTGSDEPDDAGAAEEEGEVGEELPWPSAFQPVDPVEVDVIEVDVIEVEVEMEDATGELEVVEDRRAVSEEDREFETKLEAWATGTSNHGPRHFRRI